MERLATIAAVRARRAAERAAGRSVAFVPTMGSLHEGHLSLVRRARELADRVWVSVFVNPTQFGPGEDFDLYPRDLERDAAMLEGEGVAALFAPPVDEIYPRPAAVSIGFGGLEQKLCGADRPSHFAGVGLVVAKLLNIVQPGVAVFGQKDAQQALLIRRLVADLNLPVDVVVAPTLREADGLAMSSRNAYLTPEERRAAPVLYGALNDGAAAIAAGERSPAAVCAIMARTVAAEPHFALQYAECVDDTTLERPSAIFGPVLLAIAARIGRTRLIDNLPVIPPAEPE